MFTEDARSIIAVLFEGWKSLMDITFPGTNASVFGILCGCVVTVFAIRLIREYINVVGGAGGSFGNTNRPEHKSNYKKGGKE